MKNNNSYKLTGMRMDALMLAFLMFFQTIFPVFAYSRKDIFQPSTFVNSETYSFNDNSLNFESLNNTEEDVSNSTLIADDQQSVSVTLTAPLIPGGPDQPEVQSFTPVGTDGMVDPFTGDFSYNIPLLDIDGYPINLAYNAGIGMEQEASWVGLGWNLNPGVINRNMRGIPDDFNGTDVITQEFNQKPNSTFGVNLGVDYEIFAIGVNKIAQTQDGAVNLSANLGIQHNNYTGYSADYSFGPSFGIAKKVGLDVGLQISGNSQGGASIGGNVSFGYGSSKVDEVRSKISIGSSFNSRQGLQQLSINFSVSKSSIQYNNLTKKNEKTSVGSSLGSSFNFGMPTYVSQIPFETRSNSYTARFKLGPDLIGNDLTASFTGFFSKSTLASKSKSVGAYGYMHLDKGQNDKHAMLDFNRENDGSFTKNTPALPIPQLTYDIYSVSGHGVSGSYRMDRQDMGYVFDPYIKNNSGSYSLGAEVGLGGTFKTGMDVGAVHTNGSAGVWAEENDAANKIKFNRSQNYFRDASELSYDESDGLYQNIGGASPAYFPLTNFKKLSNQLKTSEGSHVVNNNKSLKFRRNQPLTSFTIKEVKNGYGFTKLPTTSYANSNTSYDHHIGAFTVTKTDGARYYYGLPAYTKNQENVSFAVGLDQSLASDWNKRLVTYTANDASVNNVKGLDNHYNSQKTPAYVHTYMLTAVLGTDYIDSDAIPGPSKGDFGSYVEFKYKQVGHYKWRNPVEKNQAFHDRGLNADPTDDKANFIYGEKELWYLDTIKTKNHLLIFYTSHRKDAVSVNDRDGGIAYQNARMQQLDSIKLYSRTDYEWNSNPTPIKTVHFRYNYSLCKDYPGNIDNYPNNSFLDYLGGKLTLTKVWFTYEKSHKGERTPYEFYYDQNPNYNPNNVDRWGTYKPNPLGLNGDETDSRLSNSDFPYVGYDTTSSNIWAAAWNLSRIKLPSGGSIRVLYESDDYGFVQHKRAKQMFKIVDVEECGRANSCSISDATKGNRRLYFEMIPDTDIREYGKKGDLIYFKALLSMNKELSHYDYVPGYALIEEIGVSGPLGYIDLVPGRMKVGDPSIYNPIAVTGVQFARNYLSRIIPPSNQDPQSGNFMNVAHALLGAFKSTGELFTGPNLPLWRDNIGSHLLTGKSWIRLNNPSYSKLGGGHRVKEIRTYDAWNEMTNDGQMSDYGQQYIYSFDGKSSGVASYEPQIGGEENVWRTYVANDISMTWAPDIRNYMETPFGEQLFPSPSVGYSKVLIRNIERTGVVRTATGHTINEFYTAQDFPTIAQRTSIDNKNKKYNLNLLLYSRTEDIMAASQGFSIENNDMHGKPKATKIYAQDQLQPYSSVEYIYQSEGAVIENMVANKLKNEVKVILPNGTQKNVVVGRTYEAVADFRENKMKMKSANLGINLNYTIPFIFVPLILGANYSESKTEFRSAVFAKSIERKGILHKTIAVDYLSKVETENLAYDSETGDVLLTSVNNNFKDTVYNFTYPAHWIYQGMGQAYKNLEYTSTVSRTFSDGYNTEFAQSSLLEGDEVIVVQSGNYIRAWVTEVSALRVRLLKKDGSPLEGTISYLKVIRSGNRNLQSTPIGSVTLMQNPLNTLAGNVFDEVINAQSIEYSQNWKTFCDCDDASQNENPYVLGLKGNWNPKATYLHLSDRTQTFENSNTNIRKDGLMESFTPFYRLNFGQWGSNKQNWTYTSEVTDFSPFGQAVETVDALNRYSTTQTGYNQTLPVAVSANSQRRQAGFDGFEDYVFESCPDDHFHIGTLSNLTDAVSHTGRYSIAVSAENPVIMEKQIKEVCDVSDCDLDYVLERNGHAPTEYLGYKISFKESEGYVVDYDFIYGSSNIQISIDNGIVSYLFERTPTPNSEEYTGYKIMITISKSSSCSETQILFY